MRRVLFLFVTIFALEILAKDEGVGFSGSGLGGIIHRELALGFDGFLLVESRGLSIAVGAPLRFVSNGIRKKDWDEVADFGKIVSEVRWGKPGRGFYLKIGCLTGYGLGLGDLVSGFYSTVDLDHWHTGLQVSYKGRYGGVDGFVGSILAPEITGLRLYLAPFGSSQGIFSGLEFGGSFIGDFRAPFTPQRVGKNIVLDEDGLPKSERKVLLSSGFDIRWAVIRMQTVEVSPYFAFSNISDGIGTHLGIIIKVKPSNDLGLELTSEWKYLGRRYVSPYFDALYAIDRYEFLVEPKARLVSDVEKSRYGVRAGFALYWRHVFSFRSALDLDWEGMFTSFRSGLVFSPIKDIRVLATLTERGIDSFSDMFDPERGVLATLFEWQIHRNVAIFGSYVRDVMMSETGKSRGRWVSTDTALGGIRLTFFR